MNEQLKMLLFEMRYVYKSICTDRLQSARFTLSG